MAEECANSEAPVLSDEVWEQIAPLLPRPKRKNRKGRPRASDRATMMAILYRLRTGCAWKALPRQLGGASTAYDRFQEWREAGVFEHMWQVGLLGEEEFERV